ncbi:MAG: phosphatidate cytidylyltransferase [Oscillospiraceae bacterium]|nr:phosphatidate cytidylyltransferase [Oscillospiraceae bacterium]
MRARILVASVGAPALAAVLLACPEWAAALLMCAVSALSARELVYAAGLGGETFALWPVLSAALTSLGVFFFAGDTAFTAVLLALCAVASVRAAMLYGTDWHKSAGQIFCAVFAGAVMPRLLSDITRLRMLENGGIYALLPFVSAFTTDAGAYFAGVLFGKHPAFPRVSPNKTLEGCAGGMAAGVAGVAAYSAIVRSVADVHIPLWAVLLIGVLGAVMAQLGDLAFSFIKREYNIKDFGGVLPGHGGILDRFDSMVFVAPTVCLIVFAARESASGI